MHNRFFKKALWGLVGLLLVVSIGYPGKSNQVGAQGGYKYSYLPLVAQSPNLSSGSAPSGASATLVASSASWKYYSKGSAPSSGWQAAGFNDSTWSSGPAPLGYGNGNEATVISYGSDASHKYPTAYFRRAFTVDNPAAVSALSLTLARDDGAVVYLNGQEVYRVNMPSGTPGYSTYASACAGGTNTVSVSPSKLVKGANVLAVEVHQCNASSSDLRFQASLAAKLSSTAPTPTAPPAQPTPTAVKPTTPPANPTPAPTQPPSTGKSFYVAPNGSSSGDGSSSRPWNLTTALNHPSSVKPGDTIWVRGGTYTHRNVDYIYSKLKGASGKPITVRAYPGERAIINASISIQGEWTNFWGLEMIDSRTNRTDTGRDEYSFMVWGPNIKLINNIIHDTMGVGFWYQSTGSEMFGNIIYSSGYKGSDRGHGHGIYTTNQTGTKLVLDNIIFNNFSGVNVHAYSEQTYLTGFRFEGNVSFNGNFLVGGLVPAKNIELINNYNYRGITRVGYSTSVTNENLTMIGNILDAESEYTLEAKNWKSLNIRGNQFRNEGSRLASLIPSSSSGTKVWDQNTYYSTSSTPFLHKGSSQTFSQWRSTTSYDGSSTLNARMPSGQQVIVRANKYEAGRGHVIVYNWALSDTVTVDLSKLGLKPGESYVLHNAQNYFAETIKFTYDGRPISIPMKGWTIVKPIGWSSALEPATFPEFGVFVIAKY